MDIDLCPLGGRGGGTGGRRQGLILVLAFRKYYFEMLGRSSFEFLVFSRPTFDRKLLQNTFQTPHHFPKEL